MLEADSQAATLHFRLPAFHMPPGQPAAEKESLISLPGWARTSEPGHPDLPFTSVMLQVPPEGDIRVDILSRSDVVMTDYRPPLVKRRPVTLIEQEEELGAPPDDPALSEMAFPTIYPENNMALEPRAWWRGVPVCRLKIYPFQWDSRTNRLRIMKDLRLRIDYTRPLIDKGVTYRPALPFHLVDPFRRMQERILIDSNVPLKDVEEIFARKSGHLDPSVEHAKITGSTAVRIETREAGIHRFSYKQIDVALGDTLGTPKHNDFRLFRGDKEIAFAVIANDDYFRPGDQIEFYAEDFESIYTRTNVYRLEIDDAWPGLRAEISDGTVTGTGQRLESFWESLHFEKDKTMWASRPGAPVKEYWFWQRLTAPASLTYTILLPAPDPSSEEALIRVSSQGRSTPAPHPNHHHKIRLNNVQVLDQYWDGDEADVQQQSFPASLIADGSNAVLITAPGDTGAPIDVTYHNYLEVEYWRLFKALDDQLVFTVSAEGRRLFELENFQSPVVRIYDITDPARVRLITRYTVERAPDTGRYLIRFEDDVPATATYCAMSSLAMKTPDRIERWENTALQEPDNGADLLIITAAAFLPSMEPLVEYYRQQRFRVLAVSTQEIYDQFNGGIVDPLAIKIFLRHAYNTWLPPAPTYVLLVGDANIDYHDNYNTGKKNRVPPFLTFTRDVGLVPDDNWLVAVDGNDSLPDMFIGRLPGAEPSQVTAMMDKLLGHRQNFWDLSKSTLFVTDNNTLDFEERSEALIAKMPENFGVSRIYLREYGSDVARATEDIIRNINDGLVFTNYLGHGAVTNWAGEYMFDSADIPQLVNHDRLTFVNAMNCINGFFAQPFYYCLAEEFLISPNGGAVGYLSPSGTMYSWEIELFSNALFDGMFTDHNTIMGSLATSAKIQAYARGATVDLLTTSVLIGDPAARLFTMLPGDLNADGHVDALDLFIGKQVLAGIFQEYRDPCPQPAAADFNLNGHLDSTDLTYLAQLLVASDH
ncbi:MAG: hypothetical protein JXQ27_17610 [Acidobacteria bacterium]|nr:hypothetical protein [Acidobacteriota bacterium]